MLVKILKKLFFINFFIKKLEIINKNRRKKTLSRIPIFLLKHENIKRLKGFKKIFLNPRESKNIKIEIPIENLQLWNVDLSRYETQKGKYHIYLGTSSENLIWSNPFVIE